MLSSQKQFQPNNHVIYDVVTDLEFSILFNEDLPCELEILVPIEVKKDEEFAKRQEALEQKQKDDQINVVQEEGYKGMFYEECYQPITKYVCSSFEEYFGPPMMNMKIVT